MSEEFILETRGLTKEFKGFVAVSGVDLKVRRGHIHALIGPNGAGKTTFFNLLTKFLTPTRGSLTFNGKDITATEPAHAARPRRGEGAGAPRGRAVPPAAVLRPAAGCSCGGGGRVVLGRRGPVPRSSVGGRTGAVTSRCRCVHRCPRAPG